MSVFPISGVLIYRVALSPDGHAEEGDHSPRGFLLHFRGAN